MAATSEHNFPLANFTEGMIQQHASPEVYERGVSYWQQGAVDNLVLRGDKLTAEVQGSDYDPYLVSVTFTKNGVGGADCTCPYAYGGWCKHIVAALLQFINTPESVDEQETLEIALAALNRDQLLTLVVKLVEHHPRLADELALLASQFAARPEQSPDGRSESPPVDPVPFRRSIRAALRGLGRMDSSDSYWNAGAVVREIGGVLQTARALMDIGNARGALVALEAITEEYLEGWDQFDDSDGDFSGVFADLGKLWTEAILSVELSQVERTDWEKKLEGWQEEIDECYIDEGFHAAIGAVRQGWDDPKLVRILRGEELKTERDNEEELDNDEDDEWYSDALIEARLSILERQGRYEEALHLARWAQLYDRAAIALVKLDRAEEAEKYVREELTSGAEVFSVAKAFREHGDVERAFRVGEYGLNIEDPRHTVQPMKYELAIWQRDFALEQERNPTALNAAVVAARTRPDLADWKQLGEIAGDNWINLRVELLGSLVNSPSVSTGAIEILLHEGLIREAVLIVREHHDYNLVARVVDAAVTVWPDEVIPICRKQAESIMNAGNASHYDSAAHWLARAQIAYHAGNRDDEWRAYLAEIMARHKAKYKLMPLLRDLEHR